MKKLTRILLFSVLAVFLVGGTVSATPMLTLSDGINPMVTISDGAGLDSNPAAGAVTYIGAIGNWVINVSTGVTKPIIGQANYPILDLNSVNTTSGGAGVMTIAFSEKGFSLPDGLGGFSTAVGGTTNGTVQIDTYLDDVTNTELTLGTHLSQLGPFGPVAFSGSAVKEINPTDPFSLTLVATVTHAYGTNSSFDAELSPVPEPATMLLFGTGLLGIATLRRKIKKS